MAFNPDEYLQKNNPMSKGGGGFDPDAYLAGQKTDAPPSSAGQTALESFGNTATMGYLPHAQAVVGSAMGLGDYTELRDENLRRQKVQAEQNPKAAAAGTVLGIGASALIPSAAFAKGATTAAKLLNGAKTGAAYGALANPGDTEGEISPVQLEERAKNAGVGVAFGVGGQGVLSGLQKGAEKVSPILRGFAEKNAAGAIGITKAVRKKMGDAASKLMGREALDEGVINVLSTPGGISKRTGKLKEETGETIGGLIKGADVAGASKIDTIEQALKILDDPEILSSRNTPGATGMYDAALRETETLARNGELTLEQAHKFRRALDKSINFNKKRMDMKPGEQEVLYKIRDTLNDAISAGVDSTKMAEGGALKAANKRFSTLSKIEDIADNRAAMNDSNRSFGLTDTLATVGGLATGGTPASKVAWGAALGGVNKFARTFGDSIAARSYDGASKALAASGKKAGSVDGGAVARALSNATSGDRRTFDENGQVTPEVLHMLSQSPELINSIEDPKLRLLIRKKLGRAPGSQ